MQEYSQDDRRCQVSCQPTPAPQPTSGDHPATVAAMPSAVTRHGTTQLPSTVQSWPATASLS